MQLELSVDRIEGERVVLIDQEQNIFVWPKNKVPAPVHEGQILLLEIKDGADKTKDSPASAKDILNEVLNLD